MLITETDPRTEEVVVREQKEILTGMYSYITSKGYLILKLDATDDYGTYISKYIN